MTEKEFLDLYQGYLDDEKNFHQFIDKMEDFYVNLSSFKEKALDFILGEYYSKKNIIVIAFFEPSIFTVQRTPSYFLNGETLGTFSSKTEAEAFAETLCDHNLF